MFHSIHIPAGRDILGDNFGSILGTLFHVVRKLKYLLDVLLRSLSITLIVTKLKQYVRAPSTFSKAFSF